MSRGAIAVGDLAAAFRRLAPRDDATRRAIAALLGARWKPAIDIGSDHASRTALMTPPDAPLRPPEPPPETSPVPSPDPLSVAERSPSPTPSRLTQTRAVPRRLPPWIDRVDPLELPDRRAVPTTKPAPLFEERYTRSILSIALASETSTGDVDLDAVLATISHGQPLTSIPRLPRKSLARGVQLLLDRSEAMLPYLQDLPQITAWVRRVAGDGGLQILRFAGCPTRGTGLGSLRTRKDYWPHHHPPRGARVLCVTDLGAGRPLRGEPPASPEEWLDFAHRLRLAGCPFLVLTPYGPERLPPELSETLPVLHWSRASRAGTAVRAARRGEVR